MPYGAKAPDDVSGDIFTERSPIRAIYSTTLDRSQQARENSAARSYERSNATCARGDKWRAARVSLP